VRGLSPHPAIVFAFASCAEERQAYLELLDKEIAARQPFGMRDRDLIEWQ